jgi:hypothetical protein
MYGAFIASLSAVALMLAASETFAASGATARGTLNSTRAGFHSRLNSRALFARSLRHHRGNNAGTVWPGVDDSFNGPSNGEPIADVAQPASGDVHYTYTHDVPWDWAHRFPPSVAPSERPYVPSCPAETVTVPGYDGGEHTVNVIRCY